MTKEELEKESNKYAEKVYGNSTDIDHYGIADAYYNGAEPREKRIAELEAQIEKMKNCDNCKHDCKLVIAHFGGCDFLGKKEKWKLAD